ncbi:MAG: universal stress protein [Streptosporangiaceae bacterium]
MESRISRRSPASRVVVGVDDSAASAAALVWAMAEASRRQAALHIVSAWEEPDPAQPDSARVGDPAQIAAARVRKALATVLRQGHRLRRVACATPMSHPGKALLDAADGADLLVLGANGISAGRVPGSTGLFCQRHARGPLVFVPA